MPTLPAQSVQPVLTYVDRPDVAETFVDTLEKMTFDGTSLRLEFVVNRFDQVPAGSPVTGQKVTAERLIVPLPGAIRLAGALNAWMDALKKQGVIKEIPNPGAGGKLN